MNAPEDRTGNSAFETRTKTVFDASVSNLDARTRSRLTQARHAALAVRAPTRRHWILATGLATAALLVIVVASPRLMTPDPAASATLADDDMPLLLDSDSVEMIEDLEFYAWLDDAALSDDNAVPTAPAST